MSRKPITPFEKACKQLKRLKVSFTRDYEYRGEGKERGPHDVDVFTSIRLPLTAHEIVALTINEGHYYIGGCCGSSSVIQDKMDTVYRFHSGWMPLRDLSEIAEGMINHDSDSPFRELTREATLDAEVDKLVEFMKRLKERRKEGRSLIDPWYLMAVVWHLTKDFYGPERPRPAISVVNKQRTVVEDAISTLALHLRSIAVDAMFERADSELRGLRTSTQRNTNRLVALSRLLPALKILNEGIDQIAPPPLEGVAIVLGADPDNVLSNGMGLCVYANQADAQQLIDAWTREDAEYIGEGKGRRQAATDFTLRPVRVSREQGIEFLEDS